MVNVGSEAGHFFQSDAEIKKQGERQKRVNFTAGDAEKMSSKVLAIVVIDTDLFVAESGGMARRFQLDKETRALVRVESANKKTRAKAKVEFLGHQGPVTTLALSHDSSILWTGSWDKTIKKWDAETGKCLATLHGHTDFVKTLIVVDNVVYSGSADNHIRRWEEGTDAATGETTMTCTKIYKKHTRPVDDLAVSEDGSSLYSASSDRSICRWNLTTGECETTFEGHDTNVYSVTISEDDMWTASADKTVRRWSIETGLADTCLEHPDFVKCVATVGPYVVTGASDGYVRVWDIATGKPKSTIVGHFDEVSCLAVLGSMVYSGSLDNTIRRWPISEAFLKEQDEIAKKQAAKEEPEEKTEDKETKNKLTEEEERELAELMLDD